MARGRGIRKAPPRGPVPWGSPRWGRGSQETRLVTPASSLPSRPLGHSTAPGAGLGMMSGRRHAGSLEALRVARPKAVVSWNNEMDAQPRPTLSYKNLPEGAPPARLVIDRAQSAAFAALI